MLDAQGTVLGASYVSFTTVGGPTAVEEVPHHAFRLAQNYPNPFSGATTVAFELERPGYVTLRVFDLMGREVARLVDGQMLFDY